MEEKREKNIFELKWKENHGGVNFRQKEEKKRKGKKRGKTVSKRETRNNYDITD